MSIEPLEKRKVTDQVRELETEQPKRFERVPLLGGAWPILGHLHAFPKDPVGFLLEGTQEHGELFKFKLGPRDFVLFSGLEAQAAYFKELDDLLDPRSVYQFTVPIFGRGVAYDVAPEIMTEQLGFLFPALRVGAMKRYVRIIYDEAVLFAEQLGTEGELDLPTAMNQLTVNIASRCFLGEELRREVDAGFAEAYHELQNGLNTLGFFFPRLPTPAHKRRDDARRRVVQIFNQIMSERRQSGVETEDFMYDLMRARYQDGRSLTDDEITGLLLTVLFAGQHTSAVLAAWVGLELTRDWNYLERVREETRNVYNDEGAMSYEGLRDQVLLENAVRECERLHPPLILLIRKALAPLRFRDYVLPTGTMAMVSPSVSHRLPDLFPDPEHFYPDRFAPPRSEEKQHQYALIGFGGGKHKCMGKNFAYLQIKALWSVLIDRFDFSLDLPFPDPNYGSWVTGPRTPCLLKYREREGRGVFR